MLCPLNFIKYSSSDSAVTEGVDHSLARVLADVHPMCTRVVHQFACEFLQLTVTACPQGKSSANLMLYRDLPKM